MPERDIDPLNDSRRLRFIVTVDVIGKSEAEEFARLLCDYLNADEANGHPIAVVPVSWAVMSDG